MCCGISSVEVKKIVFGEGEGEREQGDLDKTHRTNQKCNPHLAKTLELKLKQWRGNFNTESEDNHIQVNCSFGNSLLLNNFPTILKIPRWRL